MRKTILILTLLIVVFLAVPSYAADEFIEEHTWGFRNTTYFTDGGGTTILPWEIYVRSFIGICPDSNIAKVDCPLDYAFYHAYNAAFAVAAGNCFGMSLLTNIIYKEEGHMGFCKPIYTYSGDTAGPTSAQLCTVITVMQCHEWSHSGIMWMAENITGTHAADGNYAYEQVEYYLSMGDLPVLTIVKDASFVGHTLVPYRIEETSSKRYIYIHDSNKWIPEKQDYYDNDSNYIEINKSSGDWSYYWGKDRYGVDEFWGSSSGGYIFATPMSTVKASSRNPLQLGGITDALNHVFLTGANISQITDDEGHRFYKSSASSHNRLSDIEDNPSKKMKNVFRMPMIGRRRPGRTKNAPEIYFAVGSVGKDLNFEINATGKKYKFEMAGKDNIIRLNAPAGSSGKDNFKVKKLSADNQELHLSSKRGAAKFEVELQRTVPGSETSRIFKVTDLKAPSSSPVKLRLAEGRDALLLKGEKQDVSFKLEITQVADGKITKMPARTLKVSGKKWQQVVPDSWNKLKGAKIKVQMPPDPPEKKR